MHGALNLAVNCDIQLHRRSAWRFALSDYHDAQKRIAASYLTTYSRLIYLPHAARTRSLCAAMARSRRAAAGVAATATYCALRAPRTTLA